MDMVIEKKKIIYASSLRATQLRTLYRRLKNEVSMLALSNNFDIDADVSDIWCKYQEKINALCQMKNDDVIKMFATSDRQKKRFIED